jgi:hypothetical protein
MTALNADHDEWDNPSFLPTLTDTAGSSSSQLPPRMLSSPLPSPCFSLLSSSSPLQRALVHVTSWIVDIFSSSGSRRLLYVTVMLCAQGGIMDEVRGGGGCNFDFDVSCSARCEPCWRDWLRSEVAVSESAGYTAGWMITCASAGTDVL